MLTTALSFGAAGSKENSNVNNAHDEGMTENATKRPNLDVNLSL